MFDWDGESISTPALFCVGSSLCAILGRVRWWLWWRRRRRRGGVEIFSHDIFVQVIVVMCKAVGLSPLVHVYGGFLFLWSSWKRIGSSSACAREKAGGGSVRLQTNKGCYCLTGRFRRGTRRISFPLARLEINVVCRVPKCSKCVLAIWGGGRCLFACVSAYMIQQQCGEQCDLVELPGR